MPTEPLHLFEVHVREVDNPLRVHYWVQLMVLFYLPVVVFVSLILNGLSLQVLKSEFLRDLTSQPILKCLLALHCLLPIVGPFYVWLVQGMHVFITIKQVYSCFLLLTLHNFLTVASSWTLILFSVERAITLSKSKAVWKMWQTACFKVTFLMLSVAALTAIGSLVFIDGPIKGSEAGTLDPICMPWWGQEPKAAVWFQFITVISTVGPCLAIVLSILVMMVFVVRFCTVVHLGSKSLDHYKAINVGLKSVMHLKFIHSVLWLGFLFILTSGSLGLFILLPPESSAKRTNISLGTRPSLDMLREGHTRVINQLLAKSSADISKNGDIISTLSGHLDEDCDTLSCTQRADFECLLWLLYYSFSLMIVPVLVLSEVLFRRELKGLLLKIGASFLCFVGKGKVTRPMTIQLHAAFSSSDVSVCHGEDIVNKLDPAQNANVECFVHTGRWPGDLKVRDTTMADDVISRHTAQIDDVKESRLQTDYFKSQNESVFPKSDATGTKAEDEI